MLACGLGVLLLVRLVALWFNATDLFFDEAQYWSWSLEPAFGYYSKPPLIAWLIAASSAVCGVSEFCIRLPAPILHTATAAAIFVLGWRLYDARTGLLAGLTFATLPGVTLSAGIISTDVPLLLCWALALIGFAALLETRSWWPALLLGVAFGAGLNAKYAMAWFVLCAAIYLAVTPQRRPILRDIRLWSALAIGTVLIAPNLVWNLANGFATFAHTADNAKWTGSLINPLRALEFLAAQFGVFGPILFGGLLVICRRALRQSLAEPDRLLLAFALPVLVAITIQALISRAHANWAATAYVSAAVLLAATLLRDQAGGWLRASLGLHVALVLVMAVATATAGRVAWPGIADPFARTLGWREVAIATQAEIERARRAGRPYGAVISDERAVTAELLYYMRSESTPVMAWLGKGRPQDHFELMRPYRAGAPQPVLLVSLRRDVAAMQASFERVQLLATPTLPAGSNATRQIWLYSLSGYRGK